MPIDRRRGSAHRPRRARAGAGGRLGRAGRHRAFNDPSAPLPGRRRARGRGRGRAASAASPTPSASPTRGWPPMSATAMHRATPFGDRLRAAMDARGPLCVGIDPHAALLEQWGLPDDRRRARAFALTCVEAFGGRVAAVKPQSAFFERHGSAGVAVLERTLAGLRDAGDPVAARRQARRHRLDHGRLRPGLPRDGSPLAGRRLTVSALPRLRVARPALDLARPRPRPLRADAHVQPGGPEVQHALRDGVTVAALRVAGAPATTHGARPAGSDSGWSSARPSAAR